MSIYVVEGQKEIRVADKFGYVARIVNASDWDADTFTIVDDDQLNIVFGITSDTNRIVNLPTAGDNSNRLITIVKVDDGSGKLTITAEGTEQVGGAPYVELTTQGQQIQVLCDGTGWGVFTTGASTALNTSLLDSLGRFAATNVEEALAELAGSGRAAESVKSNADAISSVQATHLQDIADLAGPGRTTETIKDNADAIANLSSKSTTSNYVAGESIAKSQVVAVDALGKVIVADKRYSDRVEVVGIATAAAAVAATVSVHKIGTLDGFSGLAAGLPCFLGDSGALIQDDDLVLESEYRVYLGVARSATEVDVLLSEAVQNLPQWLDHVPVGGVLPFAGTTAPTGYLLCHGQAVSREDYAELFAAIGTSFGQGDGAQTFNLPDLRGQFLRGVDNGRGKDPDADARTGGDAVGSEQDDAIRNITGKFSIRKRESNAVSVFGEQGAFEITETGSTGSFDGYDTNPYHLVDFDASRVVPVGGDNRPTNVAVEHIIKARQISVPTSFSDSNVDQRLSNLEGNETVEYDTGWVACSDWTNQLLGTTVGGHVIHDLGLGLRNLNVTILVSPTGADDDSFFPGNWDIVVDGAGTWQRGYEVQQVSANSLKIQTGSQGVLYHDSGGAATTLDSEAWYYRIIVTERTKTVVKQYAGIYQPLMHIQDRKAYNASGGTFTAAVNTTRTLNTVVTNEIVGASLSGNQIKLPAGTYDIRWDAPAHRVDRHFSWLYDVVADTILARGRSTYASNAGSVNDSSMGEARLTLSGSTTIELRHRGQVSIATHGLGVETSVAGFDSIYSQVWIRKVS